MLYCAARKIRPSRMKARPSGRLTTAMRAIRRLRPTMHQGIRFESLASLTARGFTAVSEALRQQCQINELSAHYCPSRTCIAHS